MSFELPKYIIPQFLELAHQQYHSQVYWLAVTLNALNTPSVIHNGEDIFVSQKKILDEWPTLVETKQGSRTSLATMLRELFTMGLTINTGDGDRLAIGLSENGLTYQIRHESIGRYRDWCWIDQGRTDNFAKVAGFGTPAELAVLNAIHERFYDPCKTVTK